MKMRNSPQVDLFPFLSVLMCIIGVKIVVFSGLTLESMESREQTYELQIPHKPQRFPGESFKRTPVYIVCCGRGFQVHWELEDKEYFPVDFDDSDSLDAAVSRIIVELGKIRQERWPVLCVKPSGWSGMKALYLKLKIDRFDLGKWAFWEEVKFTTGRPK